MSFRDTVQAATPAPIEGKLQTKKRHTAQTFSLSVRVSLSCLLAYYTTLYVLLQFLFPAACAALWRLQHCFIVRLLPPFTKTVVLRLFLPVCSQNRLRLSPAVLALAGFPAALLPLCFLQTPIPRQ